MRKLSILRAAAGLFFISLTVFSCSTMVEDMKKMKGEVPYTVESYFEEIDTSDFTLNEKETYTLNGITGKTTEFTPKEYAGFTLKEVEKAKIASDGSSVAKIYYSRNSITVTFDTNGGVVGTYMKVTKTGKYGALISMPDNPVKTNWNFVNWEGISTDAPVFPSTDTTYTAQWIQNGARYTVRHYLEVLDEEDKGTDYKEDDDGLFYTFYKYQVQAGECGADTSAMALSLDGFEAQEIEQTAIASDGSTVINVLYNRKEINLVFEPGNGTWQDYTDTNGNSETSGLKTVHGKYGSEVTGLPESENLSREDWEFAGWSPEVPETYPAFNKSFEAQWNQINAVFTVKYYYEAVSSTDSEDLTKYIEDTPRTYTSKGKIGETTEVHASPVSGFILRDIQQQEIKADGSSVVKIYYQRQNITLTLNACGEDSSITDSVKNGKWSSGAVTRELTGKYGTAVPSIDEPIPYNSDYDFVGWGAAGITLPETFPAESTAYTAVYSQDTASYTVKYYFETTASGYEEDESKRLTLKGDIDADTNASAPAVSGFTAQTVTQQKIKADDSTEISIYYDRNTITYTFSSNEGEWSDGTTSKTVSGKYGTEVTAPSTEDLTYVTDDYTYTFTGWSPDLSETFGDEDLTFSAQWQVQNARYTVYIKVQQENEEYKTESLTVKKGTLGSRTDETAEDRAGYNTIIENAVITADGSAAVRIWYQLKTITYTFDPGTGSWADGTAGTKTSSGLYGTGVTIPSSSSVVMEDYELAGWSLTENKEYQSSGWSSEVPSKFGTTDETFYGVWRKVNAAYTVKYFFEPLNCEDETDVTLYVENEEMRTSTSKGSIGTKTAAKAAAVPGFTPVSIVQADITADDSAVACVYYSRNTITLTLMPGEGKWSDTQISQSKTLSGKYGASIGNFGTVVRSDYRFTGWSPSVPVTFPAVNTSYSAQWALTGTDYTVNYWFEKLDGNYTNTVSEIDSMIGASIKSVKTSNGDSVDSKSTTASITLTGTSGQSTAATGFATSFTGFSLRTVTQTTVTVDDQCVGDAEVNVYYDRNTVTLTFNAGSGIWSEADVHFKTVSGKYGADVTAPSTSDLIWEYHTFKGWSPSIPSTFPGTDATYDAQWEQTSAVYTVKYYYEAAGSTDYIENVDQRKTLTGVPGATTAVTAAAVAGYEAPSITQATINADHSSVVEVKYARKTVKITLKPNGGHWADASTDDKTFEGKYGAAFNESVTVERADYSFAGWSPSLPSAYPSADTTYEAAWTYTGTSYKVEYYFENTSGTDVKDSTKTVTLTGNSGADTQADALSETQTGFTVQPITQKTIASDGSTVVSVYYKRNTVNLTFSANGGKWTDDDVILKTVTGKYGTAVTAPSTTDLYLQYNTFTGWSPDVPSTFPASGATYTAQWEQTSAVYTVKYYYENADDSNYVENTTQRKTLTGVPGATTSVTAASVAGYDAPVVTNVTISADHTSVVEVKYARKTVTLTLDPNDGHWTSDSSTDTKTFEGKYGASFTCSETVARDDYSFAGWSPVLPSTYPSGDIEFAANWTYTGTSYTVEYYFENTSGTDVKDSTKTVTLTGHSGAQTQAAALSETYTGFTVQDITQKTIASDGSTVVSVYYKRNSITLTFDPNGGAWSDSTTAVKTITGLYGAAVSGAYDTSDLTRTNYECSGWDSTVPSTYPAANATFTAQWTQVTADYTVKVYKQNISDDDYTEDASLRKTVNGTINATTAETASAITGFTAKTIEQQTISADGSTVVSIYYNRKTVTLTFAPNGGNWSGSTASKTLSGKYGAALTAPEDPEKDEYSFAGWSPVVPLTYPAADTTYTAQWTQTGAKYTIKYEYQNVDGSTYTTKNTVTRSGEIGETKTITASEVEGYVTPADVTVTITSDGNAVAEVKYDRKTITLTFAPNGGNWSGSTASKTVSGLYGAAVTVPENPERTDYSFASWSPSAPSEFPASNATYTAQWTQVNAAYTVKHLMEQLDGTETTTKTETLKGVIGNSTAAAADTVTGYTAQTITQQTIKADGSTVVEVHYALKEITLTLNVAGGYWKDDSTTAAKTITGKYGASTGTIGEVAKDDYQFTGWSPAVPSTFPSANASYTAQWSFTGTTYTVKYYFEKVSATGTGLANYEINSTYTKTVSAKTGETTQATALSTVVDGFTVQTITQATVKADGSTVVNVLYNRNTITLTFDANGGTLSSDATASGKYGASVTTPSDPTRTDYSFSGWSPSVPSTYPSSDTTYTAQWTQVYAAYTVETQVEEIDGTYSVESSTSGKGKIGTTTAATASDRTGFTKTITQAAIVADGSAKAVIKFTRNEVTLTFDPNEGYWKTDSTTASKTVTGKYGASTGSVGEVARNDYQYTGWSPAIPSTFPAASATYKAQWEFTGTSYTVKYYFEKLSATGTGLANYDLNTSYTKTITSTAGAETQAAALSETQTGFTVQTITQSTVAADGTTVVNVLYNRNTVTLTFDVNNGVWSDSTTAAKTVSGKYGASVTAPSDPSRTDCRFDGWSPSVPSTFPAADEVLTAQWTQVTAAYTVETQVQQTDGTYTVESSTSAKGTIGTKTAVTADDRTGFTKTITQATITADGTAKAVIKFTRTGVTYTFAANGGTWASGTSNTVSGLYGQDVVIPDTTKLTKSGYTLVGWTPTVPGTFGTTDQTFTAVWYSNMTGLGNNPAAKDITVTKSVSGTTLTASVTVPYTGTWTYSWYIDGKKTSYVAQSISAVLESGTHTIMVEAVENGVLYFTKTVSAVID